MDLAFIKECADPALTPAIVEQFVAAVGSEDSLAITIKSGERLILVPKPATPDEAMGLVREYVGQAIVRVGVTQFPAGVGVKDVSELSADLVDACDNLRRGTAIFAKVIRIVARWYGNPTGEDTRAQVFADAVHAWRTGRFEGIDVFTASEPPSEPRRDFVIDQPEPEDPDPADSASSDDTNAVTGSSMRIDLSRIGR